MPFLSEKEQRALLGLARRAVTDAISRRELTNTCCDINFKGKYGVFVTLHVRGKLRGCIGVVEADEPLGEAVLRCAASAAQHDTRFPAIREEELNALEIEISLLSPITPIRVEEIEIGHHGLIITKAGRRGLLLPQVATEHGLRREEFLEETCAKAGLGKQAWRDADTLIEAFTCQIFSDKKWMQTA
jgi:AmmeMemoRadiSam system protein A